MEEGVFPESRKDNDHSNWKNTKTTKCEEFWPINTLKALEEIIEKIVKNQLEKYLEENSIISTDQSGFREHHSCETTVYHLILQWKIYAHNKQIIAIFLDFKRAFETIDRNILLSKLYMYEIREK